YEVCERVSSWHSSLVRLTRAKLQARRLANSETGELPPAAPQGNRGRCSNPAGLAATRVLWQTSRFRRFGRVSLRRPRLPPACVPLTSSVIAFDRFRE